MGGFGESKGWEAWTNLLVAELDQAGLILHDLVSVVCAVVEQLRKGEPLACHLVAIVGVDELIIVHAI